MANSCDDDRLAKGGLEFGKTVGLATRSEAIEFFWPVVVGFGNFPGETSGVPRAALPGGIPGAGATILVPFSLGDRP
jgi:hypothetical protein